MDTKWIEINNIDINLSDIVSKYKMNFPHILNLSPQEICIINLSTEYSSICLDMLHKDVQTISINNTFNNNVNVIITKTFPFLKNIIINITNVSNLKDLAQYAFNNNVNLHFIGYSVEKYNVEYNIIETSI
jgi:hypothetical protein